MSDAVKKTATQKLLDAVARVDDLNSKMIMTTEHRAAREQAASWAIECVRPAIAELEAHERDAVQYAHDQLAEEKKLKGMIVHERDNLRDRVERADATVTLFTRTRENLPIIGITCDVEGCNAAIGIVGPKAINLDTVDGPMTDIAIAAGWTTYVADHDTPKERTVHRCPSCTRKF